MSYTSPLSSSARSRRAARALRRFGHGAASWAYGIAITLLLVGLWGRAASTDEPVVAEATAGAVEAVVVTDRVVDWIVEAASTETGRLPSDVEPVVRSLLADPGARAVLADVVRVLVGAALADDGGTVIVDLRTALDPHLATVLGIADRAGIDPALVSSVLDEIEPVIVDTGHHSPLGPAFDATRRALRLAAVVGAGSAASLFALSLMLSEDRRRTARALGAKTFFGALGFTVMLRLGAWALDPGGGGSDATPTLRSAVAVLARSNLHVPLVVAAGGGLVWLVLRRRRTRSASPAARFDRVGSTGEVIAVTP